MSADLSYETKRIDHLGIVAGICDEIELVATIDGAVGTPNRKVSCGQAVKAMVLNGLGFSSKALYLVPDFLKNKPVELLLGAGLQADDFNDDTLGRSLDDLYARGITGIFTQVSRRALEVYDIELNYVHLDSSSFHVHGEYEGMREDTQAIGITQGYSKDHRPDLKQAVLNLMTAQEAALPIWLEALSGNSNDKKSFPETVRAYFEQWQTEDAPYVVMDSAGYSRETIETMGEHGWLMRVPETLSLAQQWVGEIQPVEMTELQTGYWGREKVCEYAGVLQRWLVIFSQAGYKRELKTLEKKRAKELEQAEVAWRKVCRQMFNCREDAKQAQQNFDERLKYHQTHAEIQSVSQYSQPGRPATGAQPEVIGYQLKGEVVADEQALAAIQTRLGKFIVATNQMDAACLSAQEMLQHYTAQGVSVERGFRFLKDPLFFAHSLFLKNPARIMALLMIMGLSLLIYSLAERKLRQQLVETGQTVPDQKRKPTQRPTMRWVFQLFEGVDILVIRQGDQMINRQVLNLRDEHRTIIRLLGPPVENCYFPPG